MWRRVPCEQQLNMGQSALRDVVKTTEKGWLFCMIAMQKTALYLPKGNWVNIPKPRYGERFFGIKCGNANELGDVGGSPGKSCLFFVRFRLPESGLTGDRDAETVMHRGSCGVQCAFVGP